MPVRRLHHVVEKKDFNMAEVMPTSSTFAMIKPGAVRRYAREILLMALENGFTLRQLETRRVTEEEARQLYRAHEGKDFYDELIAYTLSGEAVLMHLTLCNRKTPAYKLWRLIMGDGHDSSPATIRGRYANPDVRRENVVHGSDSAEEAVRELRIFFPRRE